MTITMEFPEQLIEELEVIPKTGYYTSTSEFLKDAIKTILSARKDLMVSMEGLRGLLTSIMKR